MVILSYKASTPTTLFRLLREPAFLAKFLSAAPPRSKWTRKNVEAIIKSGQTRVNAIVCTYKATAVSLNDIITVDIAHTVHQQSQARQHVAKTQAPVIFEDEDVLLLSVEAGVGEKYLKWFILPELYGDASAAHFRTVSRAYRAVAGLVLIAKSAQVAQALRSTVQCTFRALCGCVGGVLVDGDFSCRTKRTPSPPSSATATAATSTSAAAPAPAEQRTLVTVIASVPSNACQRLLLVDLNHYNVLPVKHQMRKHLALAKVPILGSLVHAHRLNGVNQGICQMLRKISFQHPTSRATMTFELPDLPVFQSIMVREKHFATSLNKKPTAAETYAIGTTLFMNREWNVSPAVLIPRESSSTLVRTAVAHVRERMQSIPKEPTQATQATQATHKQHTAAAPSLQVLDLGTGSGCLLVALLLELDAIAAAPGAVGTGVDLYQPALDVAWSNVVRHRLEARVSLVQGTFAHPGEKVVGRLYDVILCNPPYRTETTARTKLDPVTTQNEPSTALLVEGTDGLLHYREVCHTCTQLLRRGHGILIFESPVDLSRGVQKIMQSFGFQNIRVVLDNRKMARVVYGCLPHTLSSTK